MDYDRWDALLHYLFRQTQGDAWFRPDEPVSSGVALRVSDGTVGGGGSGMNTPTSQNFGPEFRVFPYENPALEPFETAVAALNPQVAIKVRSVAVHAALADVPPDDKNVYVDANTRIQILDTMLQLPHADKEQCAAFIRDERVMVVWSESLDAIVPTCQDFEDRLIKLLWRSRPTGPASTAPGSLAGSVLSHSSRGDSARPYDPEKPLSSDTEKLTRTRVRRNWYGKKVGVTTTTVAADVEAGLRDQRPRSSMRPFFIGSGVKTILREWTLNGSFIRVVLFALTPLLCSSRTLPCGLSPVFPTLTPLNRPSIGPVAHFHENSKSYSAIKARANKAVDERLPHITIQMPVYKESLATVLAPSIESLKKAMQTYARQGGTSTIFVNDDGLRLLPAPDRDERLAYYANHNIGWVARPRHDDAPGGFRRAGRFKKASNMNYGLELSLKAERHLEALVASAGLGDPHAAPTLAELGADGPARDSALGGLPARVHTHRMSGMSGASGGGETRSFTGARQYGMQYLNREGDDMAPVAGLAGGGGWGDGLGGVSGEELEERALGLAIEEMYEETGRRYPPWAANGKATRLGEYVLIVDSDTVVPEDCLRDAARELAESPTVAILQHESDVMQRARTARLGHNAFLRWKAIQDAAFVDPADGKEKIWSEANVSEDFDMALRLLLRGYIIRWATYSRGAFKEGVSLTVDDELNRWQKYAYGCSELLFHPLVQWRRRGPVTRQIHQFLWCKAAPMHYKISMMAHGIAASVTIGLLNYVLLGFEFPVDGFYIPSFEIWLATTVVLFFGTGTVGYTLLKYRLGHKELIRGFLVNLMWIPFFFFFGGLGISVSQAILAHLFSYNISWSATIKEVQRSNFFKEIPKIFRRFWFPLTVSVLIIAGMIVCSTTLVPLEWRVTGSAWGVIFPLSYGPPSAPPRRARANARPHRRLSVPYPLPGTPPPLCVPRAHAHPLA
ncbi:glycosyl transferase family group 2-domain-containing protein [Mycena belliarum]|uniref:Glycosyl transferase family group 2-domain-containing protein n=1 Tax=Mycena belliarum TaxID=1033014 RepID=A0AAD6XJR2_9AGAR|nr:glycosyl transferase family group 2-domain-containing protein [Mycena belliae]